MSSRGALVSILWGAICGSAIADERKPELVVLDRFVGTWAMENTITPKGQPAQVFESAETRSWTKKGTSLHFQSTEGPEYHMIITYNVTKKSYSGVMLAGVIPYHLECTWNEKKLTMEFKGAGADGSSFVFKHRFIDKDNAESSGVVTNAAGQEMFRQSSKQSRKAK